MGNSAASVGAGDAVAVAAGNRVTEIRTEIEELLGSGRYERDDPVVQALQAELTAAERRFAALRVQAAQT